MPRSRTYKCTACGTSHERPTGKHCPRARGEELDVQPNATEQTGELAKALQSLKAQMDDMSKQMGEMRHEAREPRARGEMMEADNDVQEEREETDMAAENIPSVRELRRDYQLGREVNRRLAELDFDDEWADTPRNSTGRARGKRSGAARTVQDKVLRDIDWPHFHIYTPPGEEPMTFERLSIPEFVYGYLHMVDQTDAKFDRQIMWDFLKNLMEDAAEFPWANVLNFFLIVGSQIENDRLKWSDMGTIGKLRVKHAQKHELVVKKEPSPVVTTATPTEKLRYCGPYQRGQCAERGDHGGLKHMCAFCYKTKATPYPHPEADCRRKAAAEQPKNARGGE